MGEEIKNPEPKVEKSAAETKLLAEAMKQFQLKPEHVLTSAVADGVVTIVTHGGTRVRWPGEVWPLSEIDKTGINPNPKPKHVYGPGRKRN